MTVIQGWMLVDAEMLMLIAAALKTEDPPAALIKAADSLRKLAALDSLKHLDDVAQLK